jgi:hypothetical protein
LVVRARDEGVSLTGDGGLLTAMVRQVLQTGLEVEMTEHLGYDRHDPAGRGSWRNRNGGYTKTVSTEIGDVDVFMPRDRRKCSTDSPDSGTVCSRCDSSGRMFAVAGGFSFGFVPMPPEGSAALPAIQLAPHGPPPCVNMC